MRRRPKGTGRLETLPSGNTRARIIIGGTVLQQIFERRPDAVTWLQQTAGRAVEGQIGTAPNTLLDELRDEYLDELRRRGLTETTRRTARQHLGVVLRRWGKLRLREITPPRLAAIVAEMDRLGWSPATVHNRVNRITSLFRYAVERGLVEARPLPVRRPRITLASRPAAYPLDVVDALIEASVQMEEPRYLAAVLLAAKAGLRASEIIRVRRCDLDEKARAVIVPVRSPTDRPKSGKERIVPVPQSVVDAVVACPAEGDELVVGRETWNYPSGLSRWLLPVWDAAGIEGGVRLHRLRHFWATAVANGGALEVELMEWAGWSSPAMVRRYYHGVAPGRRAPVDGLDGIGSV